LEFLSANRFPTNKSWPRPQNGEPASDVIDEMELQEEKHFPQITSTDAER
jgi:hypothetical protein